VGDGLKGYLTYYLGMNASVSTADFKKHLSDFLGRVTHKMEAFVITRHGRPVAQISPVEKPPSHLGKVKGWLEESDPFFGEIKKIVSDRTRHRPRAWTAE
jgi:prevent-host-death family protein